MHLFAAKPLLFALIGTASAHTAFTNFFVDGQPFLDAKAVRMSNNIPQATYPIASITSDDMACGVNGETGVDRVITANAASVLTFEFREWPDASQPGAIDISHKGPCAVYMKKVADPTASNNAAGPGWFKIFQETYDSDAGKWCTEKLIDTDGHLSVSLPTDLEPGYYLVRPELLALHQADKTPPDPQFYVGCAQIFLASAGTTVPPDTVSIPGYISMTANTAAMTFSIWNVPMALPYPMFGPPVYVSGSTSNPAVSGRSTVTQTIGLTPSNCILENANWCGVEVAAYSDQDGCWAASTACWNQCSDCYNSAPPTGSKNCPLWEAKCTAIQRACNANDFQGPPNANQVLTPPLATPSNLPAPSVFGASDSTVPMAAAASPSSAAPAAAAAATPDAANSGMTSDSGQGSIDQCGSNNGGASCVTGMCCSVYGYCGSTPDYCGTGCQSGFGMCQTLSKRRHLAS